MTARDESARPKNVSLATADGQLRVEFSWLRDRFIHQLVLGEQRVASIEGASDDPWPPSPPLQQLSLEPINGSDVILGVGAAGQSHWSISIEAGGEWGNQTLKFDVACRCPSDPGWLGNTYEPASWINLTPLADSELIREAGRIAIGPPRPTDREQATWRWSYLIKTGG